MKSKIENLENSTSTRFGVNEKQLADLEKQFDGKISTLTESTTSSVSGLRESVKELEAVSKDTVTKNEKATEATLEKFKLHDTELSNLSTSISSLDQAVQQKIQETLQTAEQNAAKMRTTMEELNQCIGKDGTTRHPVHEFAAEFGEHKESTE